MTTGKLTDLLPSAEQFNQTEAAKDFAPLPPGEYGARIIDGKLDASRNGTPRYKLTFEVSEGEYAGRRFWHELYLTEKALPYSKRDLAKLGVTSLAQLEGPFPRYFRCRVKLSTWTSDAGNEFNRVKSFDVLGFDREEPEPFAPKDGGTP